MTEEEDINKEEFKVEVDINHSINNTVEEEGVINSNNRLEVEVEEVISNNNRDSIMTITTTNKQIGITM